MYRWKEVESRRSNYESQPVGSKEVPSDVVYQQDCSTSPAAEMPAMIDEDVEDASETFSSF